MLTKNNNFDSQNKNIHLVKKFKPKNFCIIGIGGYVAPRHMKAIRDTNNVLVACLDPNDSVGIIDSYFPDARFFTEFERFDRHIDKLRRKNNEDIIHYTSICSPNYLHDSHIRFGLRSNTNVICEKPVVINPWNIDNLLEIEKESGKKINTILQLRLHPTIVSLKNKINKQVHKKKFEVDLSYITSRGNWYRHSWKGKTEKSGGIATNIGVHFFDMLYFVFGELQKNDVYFCSDDKASGFLEYKNARVRWFLSTNQDDLPNHIKLQNQRTFRSIIIDDEELEFSSGFTDLHTLSYKKILLNKGFGLRDNLTAVETVSKIRSTKIFKSINNPHPSLTKYL